MVAALLLSMEWYRQDQDSITRLLNTRGDGDIIPSTIVTATILCVERPWERIQCSWVSQLPSAVGVRWPTFSVRRKAPSLRLWVGWWVRTLVELRPRQHVSLFRWSRTAREHRATPSSASTTCDPATSALRDQRFCVTKTIIYVYQGLNCAGTALLPRDYGFAFLIKFTSILEKAQDRTGTSTAHRPTWKCLSDTFYCHSSKRKSKPNAWYPALP